MVLPESLIEQDFHPEDFTVMNIREVHGSSEIVIRLIGHNDGPGLDAFVTDILVTFSMDVLDDTHQINRIGGQCPVTNTTHRNVADPS